MSIVLDKLRGFVKKLFRVKREVGIVFVDAVNTAVQRTHSRYVIEKLSGRPGLIPRSGALKRSFVYRVLQDKEGVTVRFRIESPYFRTHSTPGGFLLFPTAAQALAIPLCNPQASFGRLNYSSPLRLKYAGDLTMVKVGGRAFLYSRLNERVTHILKRTVRIPNRLDFENRITQIFTEEMQQVGTKVKVKLEF